MASPPPFTLRQLQYFIAVAELKSFRRAAESCNVSQPSLSAQIAELERGLGVSLFERNTRRVISTPAAETLIPRARAVLLAAGDLKETARRFVDPYSGTLRIGVIPTIGPYLLPRIVPRLTEVYPALGFLWVEEKTEVLVRRIARGELDGAILALVADLEGLEVEVLSEDEFVLALPATHRLAAGSQPVGLDDLSGERILLLDEGHCFRDQALAFCGRARIEELGFRATSLSTLVQMVSAGSGITLLPKLAVSTETARSGLAIREFDPPRPARTVVLAWRRKAALEPALRGIAGTIRARALVEDEF